MNPLHYYTTDPLLLMFPNFIENVRNPLKCDAIFVRFDAPKDPLSEILNLLNSREVIKPLNSAKIESVIDEIYEKMALPKKEFDYRIGIDATNPNENSRFSVFVNNENVLLPKTENILEWINDLYNKHNPPHVVLEESAHDSLDAFLSVIAQDFEQGRRFVPTQPIPRYNLVKNDENKWANIPINWMQGCKIERFEPIRLHLSDIEKYNCKSKKPRLPRKKKKLLKKLALLT